MGTHFPTLPNHSGFYDGIWFENLFLTHIEISEFQTSFLFCYSSGKSSIVLKDVLILKGEKFIGMLKIGY